MSGKVFKTLKVLLVLVGLLALNFAPLSQTDYSLPVIAESSPTTPGNCG